MSEIAPTEDPTWHRSYLGIALVALAGIAAVASAGRWVLAVAILAGLVLTGLSLYLAAPKRARPRGAALAAPVPDAATLAFSARAILQCLDEPLLVLEQSGRVLYANSASHAVVGNDAERKHISAVLRTPDVLEAIERILKGSEPENVPFSFLVPVERHYRAYIARTKSAEGEAPLVLVQFHDLTALRRTEEMRADFVANASHELRTPLAAVTGFIDTLRGHAKNDADARERFLEIMSVESSRMRRLIDDLLSLTRIELNEHNPPADEVDLVALVRDAAAVLAPLAEADGIRVRIAPHEAVKVAGDRDELTQVFQNLIHNAIKYGRVGGEVHVRFGRTEGAGKRDAGGQVFAAVEDQGEGIPRDVIPRLTERFYRVDVKRSRERGGTGLGLAIVKHILNRHKGRLQIESTLGEGSIFTVFLPAGAVRPPALPIDF